MESFRLLPRPTQEPKQHKQLPHRVFVGGLPKKATNESLMKYFLQFGRLTECRITQDAQTQANKNYAFVAFQLKEDYDRFLALDMVRHKYLNAVLTIKPSQSKEQVEAAKKDEANRKVCLFNIPHQTKVEDLRKKLQVYFGEIEHIDQHFYRGFAFILFKNRESAESLIQSGTFKFNAVIIEARRFIKKEDSNNQTLNRPQEPSNIQNAWSLPALLSQQSQEPNQQKSSEPANHTLISGAHNTPIFGFSAGASALPYSSIVVNPPQDENDYDVPFTRDRARTELSSTISVRDASEFKQMGLTESIAKPEAADNKSLNGSQLLASEKRKDKSSAGSKNESAQSRIKADQEKTISYLWEDEDDTQREVSDSFKHEELSSTTVSKLASNFDDQAATYRYQPVHEHGKLFSMFEQKSSDIQAGLDKLLFKSEILGDAKTQPDNIKSTAKKHLGFE